MSMSFLVLFLLRFACMANENILWHIQVEEEKYWDNEMALRFYLCLFVLALHPSC